MVPAEFNESLRVLLDRELAAGNAIREVGREFPQRGSILVQLREPFKAKPTELPPGVEHVAVSDPHWWMDEYRAGNPPHLLVG